MYVQITDIVWVMDRSVDKIWYFDKDTYEIITHTDRDDIDISDIYRFVPIPTTDYDLIREKYINKNNLSRNKKFTEAKNHSGKFHILINDMGMYRDYCLFEYEAKRREAAEWCDENGIKYTIKEGKIEFDQSECI